MSRQCTPLTVCGPGRYASTLSTPTSDRACSDLTVCASGEYIVTRATATSDRACASCTECSDDQYQARACTSVSDTVCEAISNCSARCEFDDQANYCKRRGTGTPCSAFSQLDTCPRDRCLYVANTAVPCRDPPSGGDGQEPIPVGNADCSILSQTACSGPCVWDTSVGQCRIKLCPDIFAADECGDTSGCVFESAVGYCRDQAEDVPCNRYFTQSLCRSQSGRCEYDVLTRSCYAVGEHPPCSLFTPFGAELCPSDVCEYDSNAPLCREKGTLTACEVYTTAESCSVMGTEYQVRTGWR